MSNVSVLIAGIALLGLTACSLFQGDRQAKPSKVEVIEKGGKYRLFVNGQEFFVKGAGFEFGDIKALARHGANSFRTWRVDNGVHTGKEILDLAHENGLMVLMGIEIGRERHGFDYDDPIAVKIQFEQVKKQVDELKNHPALLGWGIGNELNLHYSNPKVWDAVNQIAAYIHETDGNHPVTTMLAGISEREVALIRERCPALDFLSIQMYGDIINLVERVKQAGYNGPYLVTEWGATGHWEMPHTSWNAPIEQTSTEKADAIEARYKEAILKDENHCMGSYVFLWGQKQERTPTWYGLFTEEGERTGAIDVMQKFWTGSWPKNRAPLIHSARLDGKERWDNIMLDPGGFYTCIHEISDPDQDSIQLRIEILEESTDLKDGGDYETRPPSYPLKELTIEPGSFKFQSPSKPGPYRLFIYALDGHNNVATKNFPFLVNNPVAND